MMKSIRIAKNNRMKRLRKHRRRITRSMRGARPSHNTRTARKHQRKRRPSRHSHRRRPSPRRIPTIPMPTPLPIKRDTRPQIRSRIRHLKRRRYRTNSPQHSHRSINRRMRRRRTKSNSPSTRTSQANNVNRRFQEKQNIKFNSKSEKLISRYNRKDSSNEQKFQTDKRTKIKLTQQLMNNQTDLKTNSSVAGQPINKIEYNNKVPHHKPIRRDQAHPAKYTYSTSN